MRKVVMGSDPGKATKVAKAARMEKAARVENHTGPLRKGKATKEKASIVKEERMVAKVESLMALRRAKASQAMVAVKAKDSKEPAFAAARQVTELLNADPAI